MGLSNTCTSCWMWWRCWQSWVGNSFQQDKLCITDDPDHVRRVEASNGMYLQKVSGELFWGNSNVHKLCGKDKGHQQVTCLTNSLTHLCWKWWLIWSQGLEKWWLIWSQGLEIFRRNPTACSTQENLMMWKDCVILEGSLVDLMRVHSCEVSTKGHSSGPTISHWILDVKTKRHTL